MENKIDIFRCYFDFRGHEQSVIGYTMHEFTKTGLYDLPGFWIAFNDDRTLLLASGFDDGAYWIPSSAIKYIAKDFKRY